MKIHKHLHLPASHGAFPFVAPDMFVTVQEYALSEHRKPEMRLSAEDLSLKVVDIGTGGDKVRLYLVVYPLMKTPGVLGGWQDYGVGVTTRLGEALLPLVESGKIVEVPFELGGVEALTAENLPAPTWLPEGEAHALLKKRIVGLMQRAALEPEKAGVIREDDVYLYASGMAAIWRLHETLMRWREETVVGVGSIFHNTWHLYEEARGGFLHFGDVDGQGHGIDELERTLEAGKKISYLFLEFPSNPILVSADLKQLRRLADKYDFLLVVDDTIGSFSNVDLVRVADVILSSTTKSFSGYSDVMGGSVVLNPCTPNYSAIKAVFEAGFRNEFFLGDAECLLRNSEDYLARSTILNRNASAMASYVQTLVKDPSYAVTKVLYPEQSDTRLNYESFMRRPTAEFTPGYGCLFSIDFRTVDDAKTFYDNLHVHAGPHLGAHRTLALPFNLLVMKEANDAEYHGRYGAKIEQIRISAGLESEEDLIETVKFALEKTKEARLAREGEAA